MATRERRLHLAHFSLDSDGDDSDETNTPTHANGHTCALVWCDEDTARDPPPGCRPVDPLAGLASMGETYRGVRGDEAVAACVGPCATSAHVIPDATQRPKPDEHLGGHVFTSSSTTTLKTGSSPTAISAATKALCVRVAAALREGEDTSTREPWRPSRVCELGAGTGAAGLTVARVLTGKTHETRPLVVLTDRDTAALEVLADNVAMNAPRTRARCVAQRLQWDRRDERSAVLQRAANDDRMRSNTNDDDLSDETSFVPPLAKPYDLLIASDVLTGSPTDDGHLLDTATELLTGAGVGARLILAHPSKQIREKTNEALSHRDFVDEDTYEDTGVDTDHDELDPDPALTPFLNAARARGFRVREFEPSASSSSFSFVRVFDVFIPGTVPGSHLAAYGDATRNLELERARTETRALQTHMRERYARGWTPAPMPEVPTMEPPKHSTREEDDVANKDGAEETTKAGRSPEAKKKKKDGGGFCVVM